MDAISRASRTSDGSHTSSAPPYSAPVTSAGAASKPSGNAAGSAPNAAGAVPLWSLAESEWLKLGSPPSFGLYFSISEAQVWCEACAAYHGLDQLHTGVTHDGRTLQCIPAGRMLFWFPRASAEGGER